MDLAMPVLNGLAATRQIARAVPTTKVLVLSSYNDEEHVQQALKAGAAGFVMKETAADYLLGAIRDAGKGKSFFSPFIAARTAKRWRNRDVQSESQPPVAPALTNRQTEVMQLIAEGYSTKEMAGMLGITVKTVEKHRQSVMKKLDIHEIASLTRYAVFSGVVESNYAPNVLVAQVGKPRDGSVQFQPR
jgi:DNA-binding NarL/FixJ family response regulator